ncbi:MAG: hypothetical protein FJ207_14655 [Gemmatimonadetes bacterium]|nr:hypothetical protein [Gemmatimonadota bacterium]
MSSNWRLLCAGPQIQFDGDDVVVSFENGRKHRVRICETETAIEVHAVVVRAASIREMKDLPLRVWLHNRAAQLVSFRVDARGLVRAQGWVPKAGLTSKELQYVVRRVAAESDRFEFILTGKDFR